LDELTRSHVGEYQISFRQLSHFVTGFYPAAHGFEITREKIAQRLGASTNKRPAARMSRRHQDKAYRSRPRSIKRHRRMSGHSCEQSAGAFA
jgi:hypothetical protein